VQQGQVVGVGQGLAAGLGGGTLLAVPLQDGGQHGQRRTRNGRRAGRARSSARSALMVSYRPSSGTARGPGTKSARFGDAVKT
jgi:hypothetical protein